MGTSITPPSSVNLTAPSTSIGTVTPPAITVSSLFRSANSGNVPFVAQPFGTGSFQLQPTDNTVVGGNARGANAIDLQKFRSSATQVASGADSIVIGRANAASNQSAIAIGTANVILAGASIAIGQSNDIQATNFNVESICIGFRNTSSRNSVVTGNQATDRGVNGVFVFGSFFNGSKKTVIANLGNTSSGATPIRLGTLDVFSEGDILVQNQITAGNNNSIAFTGIVKGYQPSTGETRAWQVSGLLKRGVSAATTSLVGTPNITLIAGTSGSSSWDVFLSADTNLGCLNISVLGGGDEINWNCSLTVSD